YLSDTPKSPLDRSVRNRTYCFQIGSSRWYLACNARSISGEAGFRSRSKGPPGATRTSTKAAALISSSKGREKRMRLREYIVEKSTVLSRQSTVHARVSRMICTGSEQPNLTFRHSTSEF